MRHEAIQTAYQTLGKEATFYDGMITCSTLPGKFVCGLVWNMNKVKNDHYLEVALSGIPEDFSGKMLEVPVGTGVLTMPIYQTLPQAEVTCLDYSADMMQSAQRRAAAAGLKNVQFQQGDVGKLPFADESFDLVLSLNGFHAFPDKESAYNETCRVLKPGGTFCGCFYIKGEQSRTDWLIEKLYVPKGYFTHPFETATSLEQKLKQRYAQVTVTAIGSMGCFTCKK